MGARSIKALVAVALGAVLLSGCWPHVGFDAGHTRYNGLENALTTENVATLAEDWSVSLPGPPSEPIVNAGRVFVSAGDANLPTTDVEVHAIDLRTGRAAWTTSLFSAPQHSDFFIVGDVTLAAGQLWTGYAAVDFTGAAGGGRVASGVRLDPKTGAVIDPGSGNEIPALSAVHAGDHVASLVATPLTSPRAELVVRDSATLGIEWVANFPDLLPSAPAAVDGQVFVGVGNTLYAFALAGCGAATCPPTWSVPIASTGPHLVATSDALVAIVGTELQSIDRATGQVRWRATLNSGGGLAVTPDTVYVSDGGSMRAFDAAGCGQPTCSPLWSGAIGAVSSASPVVAGGVVYAGAANSVKAFSADGCGGTSCSPLLTLPLGDVVSSLSVAQGRLLVSYGTSVTSFAPT